MVALEPETGREIWNINCQGGGGSARAAWPFGQAIATIHPGSSLHFRASTDYAECEKGDTGKPGLSSLWIERYKDSGFATFGIH